MGLRYLAEGEPPGALLVPAPVVRDASEAWPALGSEERRCLYARAQTVAQVRNCFTAALLAPAGSTMTFIAREGRHSA